MCSVSAGPQRDKKKDENAEDWKVRESFADGTGSKRGGGGRRFFD